MAVETLERRPWTDQAARALGDSLGQDEAIIRAQVQAGEAELWRINGGESWLVTRLEVYPGGQTELVLVAGAGRDARGVIPHFQRLAFDQGVNAIRIHSARRGMGRLLAPIGFKPVETVYIWRPNDGQ